MSINTFYELCQIANTKNENMWQQIIFNQIFLEMDNFQNEKKGHSTTFLRREKG